MPLQTFFNLPETRQQEIVTVAFEEFALHDYQNASVSTIVKNLDIAKGSFYRYFEDKKDLYFYLLDYATRMRLDHIRQLFAQSQADFFALLIENFHLRIQFDLQYPLQSRFLYNTMQERNSDELGDMFLETKIRLMEMVKPILLPFRQMGKIRTDVELDLMAYFVIQIQIGIYDFVSIRHNLNTRQQIRQHSPAFSVPEADIMRIVEDFARILRNGLATV